MKPGPAIFIMKCGAVPPIEIGVRRHETRSNALTGPRQLVSMDASDPGADGAQTNLRTAGPGRATFVSNKTHFRLQSTIIISRMSLPTLTIRPFTPSDQVPARDLVLEGLGEHFGWIDESRNPDLDDIAAHYLARGHLFVVALVGETLVGTGALIGVDKQTGRLVRMSVHRDWRRLGLGRALVAHLVAAARERGYRRVVVETNNDWWDAIGLYRRCGFHEYDVDEGNVYLAQNLE